MTRGLFIGRFQPYHNGHHAVLREIADDVDTLVVGVGSADKSHTELNPFTAGERIEMVRKAGKKIDASVIPIPIVDVDRNAVWVSHVESLCPPFDVVYSNNTLVRQLFTERGHEVRGTTMHDRDRLSGTKIRNEMAAEDGVWCKRIPKPVVETIHRFGLQERIETVFGPSDE